MPNQKNDALIEKAVEDVQLIKNVFDKATDSVFFLGKVFFWWGIIFLLISALSIVSYFVWPQLNETVDRSNIIIIIPKICIAISALIIYFLSTKIVGAYGFNHQFLIVWLVIIAFDTLWPSFIQVIFIFFQKDLTSINPSYFKVNYELYSPFTFPFLKFAVGMLAIWALTRINIFGWLAIFLSTLYIILIILNYSISDIASNLAILSSILAPLTFIFTGLYLEKKRSFYSGHNRITNY